MGTEQSLKPGIECVDEYRVEEKHLAMNVGSGGLPVLATPAMIAFMEQTAYRCVQRYLPQGLTTVGTRVDVKHLNPAPQGATVKVYAKLVSVEGRKLVFEVKAMYKDIVIGEGTHERFIVDEKKFLEKVAKIAKQ